MDVTVDDPNIPIDAVRIEDDVEEVEAGPSRKRARVKKEGQYERRAKFMKFNN